MTPSTETSDPAFERRVEAGARAIWLDRDTCLGAWDDVPDGIKRPYRQHARAALKAADAVGRESVPAMPAVVIHITDESRMPTEYLIFGPARCFVVDENVPFDRVYEMTTRQPLEELVRLIPDGSEIGSKHDDRHEAISAKINAYLDGKPRLSVVAAAPTPPTEGGGE